MQAIHQLFERDHFARHSGIELVSVSPGKACARLSVQPWHLNGVGTVQGGALFTLADFAFAAASNSHGTIAVAINVSITFMKAVSTGVLTAQAEELAINSRLGSYTVRITDDQQALLAIFQGLAYRKKDPVPN
jgi:acyl-CoA thioesterase